MPWYVAELIVGCQVGIGPKGKALIDRQIKVLRASCPEAAHKRALEVGKQENHSYKNSSGEKVSWRFAGLSNLKALQVDEILDGTEIHSCLERGKPKMEIRRKRDLTVFWAERNKHKTAGELLGSALKPFAPH